MPFRAIQGEKMSDLKHDLFEPYIHPGSRRNFLSAVSKIAGAGAIATAGIAQST
jgi:hypothetical protein